MVGLGIGLLAVSLGLIGASLLFHASPFAVAASFTLFFLAGTGGWLIGKGMKSKP